MEDLERPLNKSPAALSIALAALLVSALSAPGLLAGATAAPPLNRTIPRVEGQAQVGQTLNAVPGDWEGAPSFSYRWEKCEPLLTPAFESAWGSFGSGDGQFNLPYGVAIGPSGAVYVSDYGNNRIEEFNSSGSFLGEWGSTGTGDGEFDGPLGIAVDPSGDVYVTDLINQRVQRFSGEGDYLGKWGSLGANPGEFNLPFGIAVDSAGVVYVADAGNHRIQGFTSDGSYQEQWGGPGSGDGEFNFPVGVTVSGGAVFVVDTYNSRVQSFTAAGSFVNKWGSEGSGESQFYVPEGIAAAGPDGLFVVDTGNNRIQRFTVTGNFLSQWGSLGPGPGQFEEPKGAAVGLDSVYVVDHKNHRVQRFSTVSCSAIAGAVAADYRPQPIDEGKRLRVEVTGTNADGSTRVASPTTAPVEPNQDIPPANSEPPAILGVAKVGHTLDATSGEWSGSPTPTIAYQWQRCDSGGSNCTDIPGATARAYALADSDIGTRLRIGVSAANTAGSANARSQPSEVVGTPGATFGVLELKGPRQVQKGVRVKLRVSVSNSGDAAGTAVVSLSASPRKGARLGSRLALPVASGTTVRKTFKAKVTKKAKGKIVFTARLGGLKSKAKVKVKG